VRNDNGMRMRTRRFQFLLWLVLACLCGLALSACDSDPVIVSGSTHVVAAGNSLPVPDTTDASGAYKGVDEYRIGAMDLLTISVFGAAELNQDVRVNSDGTISLPLIGIVHAGGRTSSELQRDIAAKLAAGYLKNPQVGVFIKEYVSQRVTVEGAVQKSGVYPLTGPTTLLQVLAVSGGLTEMANTRGVIVFRKIKGEKMAAVFDLKAIHTGAAEDPRIYGDDVVVVDMSGSKSKFKMLIQAVPLLGVFTRGYY